MPEDANRSLTSASLERERLDAEKGFRERELLLKERDQGVREAELELKRKELAASGWRNPLVVAIMAATVAASGNAVITVVNGGLQRGLEEQKAEQTRILEMIKTGDPDKTAENLRFLLDAGLVSDPKLATRLGEFLAKRKPGSGPTLPNGSAAVPSGIEYLVVEYDGPPRTVLLDGSPVGTTGRVLRVQAGTHELRLEGSQDYVPDARTLVIAGTSLVTPNHVSFSTKPPRVLLENTPNTPIETDAKRTRGSSPSR